MRMLYDPLIKKKLVLKRFFKKKINTYRLAIENAYNLFYDRFGVFYSVKEHHNIHAFLNMPILEVLSIHVLRILKEAHAAK